VDGLERELEGRGQVLRINAVGGVGGQLAAAYGVRGVPTFVLLDGDGEVVLVQVGMPDREAVVAAVDDLAQR
jgi:thioredoxin-related protein